MSQLFASAVSAKADDRTRFTASDSLASKDYASTMGYFSDPYSTIMYESLYKFNLRSTVLSRDSDEARTGRNKHARNSFSISNHSSTMSSNVFNSGQTSNLMRTRRSPIISRGYYARVHGIDRILHSFLELTAGKSGAQLLCVGCGYDTLSFRVCDFIKEKRSGSGVGRCAPTTSLFERFSIFEIDFSDVLTKKCSIILSDERLFSALGHTVSSGERGKDVDLHTKGRETIEAAAVIPWPTAAVHLAGTITEEEDEDEEEAEEEIREDEHEAEGNHDPSAMNSWGENRATLDASATEMATTLKRSRRNTEEIQNEAGETMNEVFFAKDNDGSRDANCSNGGSTRSKTDRNIRRIGPVRYIAEDLRDAEAVRIGLLAAEFDPDLPTLVITECVLVYLAKSECLALCEMLGSLMRTGRSTPMDSSPPAPSSLAGDPSTSDSVPITAPTSTTENATLESSSPRATVARLDERKERKEEAHMPKTREKGKDVADKSRKKGGDALWVTYDMITPSDPFGRTMHQNLSNAGFSVPGFVDFPTLAAQKDRFRETGWEAGVETMTMLDYYDHFVQEQEKRKISGIEIFDEFEEWRLLMSHYSLTLALLEGEWEGEGLGAGNEDDHDTAVGEKGDEEEKERGSAPCSLRPLLSSFRKS